MILKDIAMLLTEQPRSRAYLQNLIKHGLFPNFVIYLRDINKTVEKYEDSNLYKEYFDINYTVKDILIKYKIEFKYINTIDCNDLSVIEEIKNRRERYFVFSASGILKEEILNLGKEFIHIHPGNIPEYRGSTCMYYSIINDNECVATAFFMNSKIDQGNVISRKWFPRPQNVDIDYIFDPYMRASLLVDILKKYVEDKEFISIPQKHDRGETYFVIHPVLKNLAVLKCAKKDCVGRVFWFLGLSGSGKTTLGKYLYKNMLNKMNNVHFIDGDEFRKALGVNLGYTDEDRRKSASIIIYIAKILSENGINVVIANQGAYQDLREKARRNIPKYCEIYVKCSIQECMRRDVKGLYKKAIEGNLSNFLGIDQKFDEPVNPDFIVDTEINNLDDCYEMLNKHILNKIDWS